MLLLASSQVIAYIDRVNFAVVGPQLISIHHYAAVRGSTRTLVLTRPRVLLTGTVHEGRQIPRHASVLVL